MVGCLHVLKDAADGVPCFAWLDAARRDQARDAVRRAVACILKCQIRVDGKLTGWCQQHDEKTYEPRPARTFELASICPQDTTQIIRFLMRVEKPQAEMVQAMDAAVAWMAKVKLPDIRIEKVAAPKVEFRHYEIGTDRPIFAGRDAVKKYALAEIERERRTGTVWYGNWPQKLIEQDYPKWRKAQSVAEK
jgi:PelA/Pel-15E family pectate lyase